MADQAYRAYLREIQRNLSTGDATEHTHRPALKTLLESVGDGITVINEPRRIECGAPDLRLERGSVPIGYIEAKNIGASLREEARSEQLRRYRESLTSLILTDYLEFWWYVDGERRETARLAELIDEEIREVEGGAQAVSELSSRFFTAQVPTIAGPRELAERMAGLAKLTRNLIEGAFQHEAQEGSLHAQYKAFREVLIPDLTYEQFADMYAQTIAYGLFAARCNFVGGRFTREHAPFDLPKTNPFLRKLFVEIAGPDLDDRIAWAVDHQAHLLDRADMAAILKDFGKRTAREDPVVHFYETFLAKYDPKMRKARGVYYTPEPVVWYIVRSIDHLLKARLNRPRGLADENTLILDPACGTGTFLFAVIDLIRESFRGQEGMWNGYVREHLLPRIFGFELLMAPYAVAHMKLGIQLRESGYDFEGDERLGIYLTNALEEAVKRPEVIFGQWIADEADAAADIKRDKRILVVLANPPYKGESANRSRDDRGELTFIGRLIEDYKQVDGKPMGERNPKMLHDDYVKFIRFAQWRIERTGEGIIGYITNHGYLDNPTFRGMRQSLMDTFNEIYVYNLHGNVRKKETTPEGGRDQNVFDIQQGVGILLCVKEKGVTEPARVHHADLWGLREAKNRSLDQTDVSKTQWMELQPSSPFYLFVPQDTQLLKEYEQGWKVTEIFPFNRAALYTSRDALTVRWSPDDVWQTVADFADMPPENARSKYKLGADVRDWKVEWAQRDLRESGPSRTNIVPILYRPFDVRHTYYTGNSKGFHCMPRGEVMRHMLTGENLGLIANRQVMDGPIRHNWVTRNIVDYHIIQTAHASAYLFPLYSYPTGTTSQDTMAPIDVIRRPNLSPAFLKALAERLNLQQTGPHGLPEGITPEDIFHYAYAVFHSPTYRERYSEFLKVDFPRLPLTSDTGLFRKLAEVGGELVALHLMESPRLDDFITHYPVRGSDEVEKVSYLEQDRRVHINPRQYFEGVPPEVWEFRVGGYQVCEKWLKDRKGRKLSYDDQRHYQRIVVALKETIQKMEDIDGIIPSWPIE